MFIGREEYLEKLELLWHKPNASFVTCRGRRRIGKSTLIAEFARRTAEHFISFEGLSPRAGITNLQQLDAFRLELNLQCQCNIARITHWLEAFQLLSSHLPEEGRTLVLLDEISWMGGYAPDFAGYLKIAWDHFFSPRNNLIFVICGSVSSWIAENILHNTGFAGRNSLDLLVEEVPLWDISQYLGSAADRLSSGEKLDMLSITGCVPRYLQELSPALSAEENIRRMCFSPDGLLFREFDAIFNEVYGSRTAERLSILKILASSSKSAAGLAEEIGITQNGHLSKILEELQIAGFIAKENALPSASSRTKRNERFWLKDNYTRFYLKYIEPRKQAIQNGLLSFASLEQLEGWNSILGLQFENLVLNHLQELLPRLGLGKTFIESASPYLQRPTANQKGCQIDLLIQTRRSAYIVEIKRQKEIGKEIIDEILEKDKNLKLPPELSVRNVLVYDGRLATSVENDGIFDFIIPFREFFAH